MIDIPGQRKVVHKPGAPSYIKVKILDHPYAKRGWVAEHRLIAEKAVGHYIHPRHPIHHVNGDGLDNRPENLVICENREYHTILHRRIRAMKVTGNPNARKCKFCKQYDTPELMMERRRHGVVEGYYHFACYREHDARWHREGRRRKKAAR